MKTTITQLLVTACEKLQVPYHFLDSNFQVLAIGASKQPHYVVNQVLGLNTDSDTRLMRDKYYCYLMTKDVVRAPFTRAYVDPNPLGKYAGYVSLTSIETIVDDILSHFHLPLVIKMNSGTLSRNVFVCSNAEEILAALKAVYSQQQIHYDHVAIAQEYIFPIAEYRAIVLDGKIELLYFKRKKRGELCGKMTVSDWNKKGNRKIPDQKQQCMSDMVARVYESWKFGIAGFDFIEDEAGKIWLIEMNGAPLLTGFANRFGHNSLQQLAEKYVLKIIQQD